MEIMAFREGSGLYSSLHSMLKTRCRRNTMLAYSIESVDAALHPVWVVLTHRNAVRRIRTVSTK